MAHWSTAETPEGIAPCFLLGWLQTWMAWRIRSSKRETADGISLTCDPMERIGKIRESMFMPRNLGGQYASASPFEGGQKGSLTRRKENSAS